MRGLSERTTSIGWKVFRVHFSADPEKDPLTPQGAAWVEKAKEGMGEARWRKEYEIDYGALSGELVFPEFDPSLHVVEPFQLNPEDWTIWMACDPHPRTPHAFLWLAVNSEGDYVVPLSWWPAEQAVVKHLVECLKYLEEQEGLKVLRRLMDVAGKGMNADEERTYFDAYREAGMYFQEAKRNRDMSGFDLIREALLPTKITVGNEQTIRPRLRIMRGNDEFVWQLSHLRYQEWKGTVTDKDPPEKPEEKRKHLVDCLAYLLLDKPRHVPRRRRPLTWKPIYESTGY